MNFKFKVSLDCTGCLILASECTCIVNLSKLQIKVLKRMSLKANIRLSTWDRSNNLGHSNLKSLQGVFGLFLDENIESKKKQI